MLAVYLTLVPFAYTLLRVAVGLALVPHGLRNTFGLFPNTGVQAHNLAQLGKQLERDGYRPGAFWAPAISLTQLVGGPLLAVGLFTRPVAAVVLVSSSSPIWNAGGSGLFLEQARPRIYADVAIATFYLLTVGGGFIRSIACSAGIFDRDTALLICAPTI